MGLLVVKMKFSLLFDGYISYCAFRYSISGPFYNNYLINQLIP